MKNVLTVKELLEKIKERHGCFGCVHHHIDGSFDDSIHLCSASASPHILSIGLDYRPGLVQSCDEWALSMFELDGFLDEVDEELEDEGIRIIQDRRNK